ncbi:RNA 2',3'-cyclic phosphodiesterase [Vibrio sp. CAU 1672]|uniref:RNA 2',3'-cyclic phosphodiesterase n=1 Tax=Vibrio sp. CAU 1672 TaxID=3032594 RepID=UPI0023DCC1BD|nr:RNA 2',3'-cyclic phosphodiesterase [Vibrio sp. CAU 1672]MDF2152304.1 RNA 2',3'-cyclic phosphodiesterase [Vibrio sp. CAU 1672]
MRLFYALTFSADTKRRLSTVRDHLADHALKGRFTREPNFHITLEFIGQATRNQADMLLAVLYTLTRLPYQVTTQSLGSFHRKGRDLVWLGIDKEPQLMALQHQLRSRLSEAGFSPEKRRFLPHVTLGRNVVLDQPLAGFFVPKMELDVRSVALMESKTVNNLLVYDIVDELRHK